MNLQSIGILSAVLLTGSLLSMGCGESSATKSGGDTVAKKEKKFPRKDIYGQKTFPKAVGRLREMHKIVVGKGEIPAPSVFKIVETIHGEGAAAHSHFHLDDGKEHTFDDDDHAKTSKEVKHELAVDLFTELKDQVRWLPDVASDSNMGEKDWNNVKSITKTMTDTLKDVVGSTDPAVQRKKYQEVSEKLDAEIIKLEELVKKLG